MTVTTIASFREKRTSADIPGTVFSRRIGWSRTRLANLEGGYLTATSEELARMDAVLNDLIAERIQTLALLQTALPANEEARVK